jgi:hypothetical protein
MARAADGKCGAVTIPDGAIIKVYLAVWKGGLFVMFEIHVNGRGTDIAD